MFWSLSLLLIERKKVLLLYRGITSQSTNKYTQLISFQLIINPLGHSIEKFGNYLVFDWIMYSQKLLDQDSVSTITYNYVISHYFRVSENEKNYVENIA